MCVVNIARSVSRTTGRSQAERDVRRVVAIQWDQLTSNATLMMGNVLVSKVSADDSVINASPISGVILTFIAMLVIVIHMDPLLTSVIARLGSASVTQESVAISATNVLVDISEKLRIANHAGNVLTTGI